MSTKFSEEFKNQLVKKALQRKPGESLKWIAERENVGLSTLTRWMQEARSKNPTELPTAKRPNDWTRAERFAMLMERSRLEDHELEGFCRKQGIFRHHLQSWEQEFLQETTAAMQKANEKKLNAKIQELERQLAQKDKVIVEQAALLVLGKKICAFWEEKKDI